ncbi:MAG: hypothetical protein WAK96_03655 [Desulfobaccales bacterium]
MDEIKKVYQEMHDFDGEIPYFYAGNWGAPSKIAKARESEALLKLLSLTEGDLMDYSKLTHHH